MTEFESLYEQIKLGEQGANLGIPMAFERLNKFIGIRKKIAYLIFGSTGSGKSAFTHDTFILNPCEWFLLKRPSNFKMKIILFSMERSKVYTQMKWLSRKIFLTYGHLVPIGTLLGWSGFKKITKDEHDMVISLNDYINEIMEIVTIIPGAQNPTGIYKCVKSYALENGKEEQIDEYNKVYISNQNEIVIPIVDHLGITKKESAMTKKDSIDKISEYNQFFRDYYGYSPVQVSQMTREKSNVLYQKMESFEPSLDDVKESGRPGEDSDCVISLFDPIRYNTNDSNYKVDLFRNKNTGAKFFRSIKILKNTYGEDDIKIGMAFHGATGTFSELPKPKDMEGFNYDSVINGNYFLDKYTEYLLKIKNM